MDIHNTSLISDEVYEIATREFGFADTKGREFGARFTIRLQVYGPHVEGQRRGWSKAEGEHFVCSPHAMRGGQLYGASQGYTFFATLAEAEAARDAYFRDAEKRAAKNKARAIPMADISLPSLKGAAGPAPTPSPAAPSDRIKGTLAILAAVGKGDLDAPAKALKTKAAKAPKEPKGPSVADRIAQIMPMLESPEGASRLVIELLTGWLPHRVSWIMAQLKKQGHKIERRRGEAGDSIYFIAK